MKSATTTMIMKICCLIILAYSSMCYAQMESPSAKDRENFIYIPEPKFSESEVNEIITRFDLDTPQRLCGRRLSDFVKVLCHPSIKSAVYKSKN